MTEDEWLNCRDPERMLEYLRDKAGNRSLRRFATACCRRIWHLFAHEESRRAVEIAEKYAEGLVSERDRQAASAAIPVICPGDDLTDPWNLDAWTTEAAANTVFGDDDYPPIPTYAATCAIAAARAAAAAAGCAAAVAVAGKESDKEAVGNRVAAAEQKGQCSLLRQIFGNPFRSSQGGSWT
jgi:hypothetical protein